MNKLTKSIDEEFKARRVYFKTNEFLKNLSVKKEKCGRQLRFKKNKINSNERKYSSRSQELNEKVLLHLVDFWKNFEDMECKTQKIILLTNYSEMIFKKISFEKLKLKRNKFLSNWRYKRMFSDGCRTCGSVKKVIRHHIVQLQNGGNNHFKNLITLCEDCHSLIHDWLNVENKVELDDSLSREYREIFR